MKRKRINLSIKREMQLRLILRILLIILIAVVLCGLIFMIGSQKKVNTAFSQFHIQLRNFRDLVMPIALIGMIAGLIGAMVFSLFFPHSLVGPLFRIERSIEGFANGDLTNNQIKIRSGDELQDLAGQVSRLMEKMKERVLALKERDKRMHIICNQMADGLKDLNSPVLRESMKHMEEEINTIGEILNEFKV